MTITSGSWQSWVAWSSKLQAESDGCCHLPPDTKSPPHRRVAVKGTGTPHGHMTSCTVPMATSDHSSSPEAPLRVVVLAAQPSGERHQTRFHDRVSFEHSRLLVVMSIIRISTYQTAGYQSQSTLCSDFVQLGQEHQRWLGLWSH